MQMADFRIINIQEYCYVVVVGMQRIATCKCFLNFGVGKNGLGLNINAEPEGKYSSLIEKSSFNASEIPQQ